MLPNDPRLRRRPTQLSLQPGADPPFAAPNGSGSLQPLSERLRIHLYIGEDLAQQSRPDGFSGMRRHHGPPAIRVLAEVLAAFDPQNDEPGTLERSDNLPATKPRKTGHT